PRTSAVEEACHERSEPQDVTSSGLDTEGSICSKRSCLTRPKDLLATSSESLATTRGVVEMNIQADRGRTPVWRASTSLPRPLLLNCVVRRRPLVARMLIIRPVVRVGLWPGIGSP